MFREAMELTCSHVRKREIGDDLAGPAIEDSSSVAEHPQGDAAAQTDQDQPAHEPTPAGEQPSDRSQARDGRLIPASLDWDETAQPPVRDD